MPKSKCNCINETDDKLREQNLQLSGYAFMMPNFLPKITIATKWLDPSKAPKGKRRSPTQMLATFCPFCGKKYPGN